MEIKKAVFVEPGHSADDEGVSLSATPASEDKAEVAVTSSNEKVKGDPIFATVVMKVIEEQRTQSKLESKPSQQGQPRGRSNNPHDSGEMLCFLALKVQSTLCMGWGRSQTTLTIFCPLLNTYPPTPVDICEGILLLK